MAFGGRAGPPVINFFERVLTYFIVSHPWFCIVGTSKLRVGTQNFVGASSLAPPRS